MNYSEEEKLVFKLFGDIKDELVDFCGSNLPKSGSIGCFITEENLDIKLELVLKSGYSPEVLDDFIKKLLSVFGSAVYATDDAVLNKRLVEILKLQGRKMSSAESMTGGNIAATIVQVPGASDIFFEGFITYDTLSKELRLGVSRKTVMENTVVSKEVAFEMVRALVNEHSSVGVSITGYAPSVTPNQLDGLCFIGVKVDDRTIVSRFVFSGDREAVIAKATNAAIFSTIKLLTEKFFKG